MEKIDKINEITKRLSEASLTMSRVPINTKREFISLANAEFAGDYGMLLCWLWREAIEYQSMKALFFDKLQNMENKLDNLSNTLNEKKEEQPKQVIKTCNGRRIEVKRRDENE